MIVSNDAVGFRWYEDENGVKYISVTSAMDHVVPKHLQNWFKKNSVKKQDQIKTTAADHGTRIHTLIEDWFYDGIDTGDIELECFKGTIKAAGLELVSCEQEVWSPSYGYAGRLDFILRDQNGKYYVGDLKTGNSYSKKTGWQLAAYLMAHNEINKDIVIEGMVGIAIPRSNPEKSKLFTYSQLDFHKFSFLACLQTFKGLYWRELKKAEWQWLETPIFEGE